MIHWDKLFEALFLTDYFTTGLIVIFLITVGLVLIGRRDIASKMILLAMAHAFTCLVFGLTNHKLF
jgi:hypothetical protein